MNRLKKYFWKNISEIQGSFFFIKVHVETSIQSQSAFESINKSLLCQRYNHLNRRFVMHLTITIKQDPRNEYASSNQSPNQFQFI